MNWKTMLERLAVYFYIMLVLLIVTLAVRIVNGQEIKGPQTLEPGSMGVFEIIPPCEAAWTITPVKRAVSAFVVDSSGSKCYFATPTTGTFTIVSAIVQDGKPVQLTATITNGSGDEDDGVKPSPEPDKKTFSEVGKWIAVNLPLLVKTDNMAAEQEAFKTACTGVIERIDRGEIKTATNARTQLQIAITAALANVGGDAVTVWLPFVTALSNTQKDFLTDKIDDLDAFKKYLTDIADSIKPAEAEQPAKEPEQTAKIENVTNQPEPTKAPEKQLKRYCTPTGCYYVEE